MWNEKYSDPRFIYGIASNDFLKQSVHHFQPSGSILCIAEGEGRNAVWLAELGFNVTAVDASEVGLSKGLTLAKSKGVKVDWIHVDLQHYNPGKQV